MKVLILGHHQPASACPEDMQIDSLVYGLARTLGSQNVCTYINYPFYWAQSKFIADWPIYLGAFTFKDLPFPEEERGSPIPIADYDVQFVSFWWLWSAVESGLVGKNEFADITAQLDSDKVILIESHDAPGGWHKEHEFPWLDFPPRLVIQRPGGRWLPEQMTVHISVPWEHIVWQKTKYPALTDEISVYAAMSDNGPNRYDLMNALAEAKIENSLLRFGSAQGFSIAGCESTGLPVGQYLRETEAAKVIVNCRGVGIDTLRVWEAFAQGKLLVSDYFGIDDFEPGKHYLRYDSPVECVEKCRWALQNPSAAATIARNGLNLYRQGHTAEAQALRILQRAGFL